MAREPDFEWFDGACLDCNIEAARGIGFDRAGLDRRAGSLDAEIIGAVRRRLPNHIARTIPLCRQREAARRQPVDRLAGGAG